VAARDVCPADKVRLNRAHQLRRPESLISEIWRDPPYLAVNLQLLHSDHLQGFVAPRAVLSALPRYDLYTYTERIEGDLVFWRARDVLSSSGDESNKARNKELKIREQRS
jgi:hypothetical protein